MENFTEQLKKLGLGDYEALVYNTLLLSSPASATFIAQKCSLSRSSVYTTLNTLIAKGLVGVTYKNDVKQFTAEDPSTIERMLKNEQQNLEQKVKIYKTLEKNLEELQISESEVPHIIFFEGQEGLKKIYLSMMRQSKKESILYIARDEFVWKPDWKFIFETDWHERVKHMKTEKNIHTKLLTNESEIEKKKINLYKNKKGLDHRFVSKKDAFENFAWYMIGDTTSLMSIEKNNLVGIQITNRNITKNLMNVFETLWNKGEK